MLATRTSALLISHTNNVNYNPDAKTKGSHDSHLRQLAKRKSISNYASEAEIWSGGGGSGDRGSFRGSGSGNRTTASGMRRQMRVNYNYCGRTASSDQTSIGLRVSQ